MKKIICIMGATSTGKSGLAVALAREIGAEVISADSMQIYRGFDVGTGKVTPEEMQGVPHHLVDCFHPRLHFSAGAFQEAADFLIQQIYRRGRHIIVAGGTGLYFRSLLQGLADTGQTDMELRTRLRKLQNEKGTQYMHEILQKLDYALARRLKPADSQRILRGLEYRLITGHTLSSRQDRHTVAGERYAALKLGLKMERSSLRKKISRRVDQMIAEGWIEEVQALLDVGIPADCPALRAIGYREIVKHLTKEVDREETVKRIKTATHQYAKRQETWFRKEREVHWFDLERPVEVFRESLDLVKKHLIN